MIDIGFGELASTDLSSLGDMANYIMLGIFTASWFALLALGIIRQQKWLVVFSIVVMAVTASFAMLSVETTVWAPIWSYGLFLWLMVAMIMLWVSVVNWKEEEPVEEVTEYAEKGSKAVKYTRPRKPVSKPPAKSAWDTYEDDVGDVMKKDKD